VERTLPEFIAIGQIVRPQGIRGELKVKSLTDYPPRFQELESVLIEFSNGDIKEFDIERVAVNNNTIHLALQGVVTREQAESSRFAYVTIRQDQLMPLEEGQFYHFELIGSLVKTTSGEVLGQVDEVMTLTANDVLVVRNDDNEFLIPMIKDVIKSIDKVSAEILIEPIEGLLDLK